MVSTAQSSEPNPSAAPLLVPHSVQVAINMYLRKAFLCYHNFPISKTPMRPVPRVPLPEVTWMAKLVKVKNDACRKKLGEVSIIGKT